MTPFDQIVFIYERIREVNSEPKARDGIATDVVRRRFADHGLVVHPLLADIYGWHNGIYHLNAFLHLLSMDDALRLRSMFEQLFETRGDERWERTHLPVFDINGDVQILLDLDSDRLVGVDLEADDFWNVAPDYRKYLDAVFAVFERRAYTYSRVSGSIGFDQRVWSAVATEHGLVPRRLW